MFLDALLEYNHWNKKWWAMRGLRINVKSASKISAFTSLKVKQFQGKIVLNSSVSTLIFINPDIQELAAYKTIFNDSTHAIKMMPSSATQLMTPQHLGAAKKLSVQELNVLDPGTHKVQSELGA
ncbi:hypothetical protein L3X38_044647 [Prunus dulcis]|uniref:Uncharacterized protein n=1 Tax=Prunus dulcis TaxID=3755 RepID=A0AAD4YNA7_PRUDU|nr:hypothetical protein L3X38_044647 [Prunus dulcis]